jgi:hypothetical protein
MKKIADEKRRQYDTRESTGDLSAPGVDVLCMRIN